MRLLFLALLLPLSACLLTEDDRDKLIEDKVTQDNWDSDGDGYISTDFGGDDCDDSNAAIFPGASEICDGYDNDCDGFLNGPNEVDDDGDGYLACTVTGNAVINPAFLGSGDCDDSVNTIFPGATEICDDVDNNCDGVADETEAVDAPSWYTDADGDGFGDDATEVVNCDQPSETVSEGGDCNDDDAGVHPDATEWAGDGNDMDCDGLELCYVDSDRDGHAEENGTSVESSDITCTQAGLGDATMPRDDCNDGVASIYTGADEYCNGLDDDCDDVTDESDAVDATNWYLDADGDGYGTGSVAQPSCTAIAGRADNNNDCDDDDADVSPDADELCDGIDNDCQGDIDEDDALDVATWYADSDGDGYGNAANTDIDCDQPGGFVGNSTDCNDQDPSSYPGASEACDSADNDCDGTVDNGNDADNDSYDDLCDNDCDDTDATVNPSAAEICDGLDNNCDTIIPTDESDVDGDLYVECTVDAGGWDGTVFTPLGGDDCDDSQSRVHPGATEDCDGLDTDCDGTTPSDELDGDADGYVVCSWSSAGVFAWLGTTIPTGGDDCDDNDFDINPGAVEHCGGGDSSIDYNCDGDFEAGSPEGTTYYEDADGDGLINPSSTETFCNAPASGWLPGGGLTDCDDTDSSVGPVTAWYSDADGDGYGDPNNSQLACTAPTGFVPDNTDCDDTRSTVRPGVAEDCSGGTDEDCDGDVDCDDSECANQTVCGGGGTSSPEACLLTNVDEDQDGLIDCFDGDCFNDFTAVCVSPAPSNTSHEAYNIYPHYPTTSQSLPTITELECGGMHTCYLDVYSNVRCFGANGEGQSGEFSNSGIDWAGVTAGGLHSCAYGSPTTPDRVYCWGDDTYGQSGAGTPTAPGGIQLALDLSSDGHEILGIAAGYLHTCATANDSSIHCWGDNFFGQTDVNDTESAVNVAGGLHTIDAGGFHTCGIATDSTLHCWGRNDFTQVGEYTDTANSSPNSSSHTYLDVAAGELHTCALRFGNIIDCWGDNSLGQTTAPATGTLTSGGTTFTINFFTGISAFGHHTCAQANVTSHFTPITTYETLICWGWDGSVTGTGTGTGNGQVQSAPVNFGDFYMYGDVEAACAGGRHTCTYEPAANELHCWGDHCQAQTCFDDPANCTFDSSCN